jgi:hypothetical protein
MHSCELRTRSVFFHFLFLTCLSCYIYFVGVRRTSCWCACVLGPLAPVSDVVGGVVILPSMSHLV